MKKNVVLIIAALLFSALPALAQESDTSQAKSSFPFTGNINLYGNVKYLNHSDWGDINFPQMGLGAELNFKHDSWPISIALQYMESNGLSWFNLFLTPFGLLMMEYGQTQEYNIGIKKIWDGSPHVRPYIGGGISYVKAYYENEFQTAWDSNVSLSFHDSNDGVGFWVDAGVYWEILKHLNLGMGLGYSYSKVMLRQAVDQPRQAIDAGGVRGGIFLGFHY